MNLLENKIKTLFYLLFIIVITANINTLKSQEANKIIRCISFYNLENLFDTINTDGVIDTEFTAKGKKAWTGERYQKKLSNMSDVISQIGDERINGGPHIIGVSEIENKSVLEDLINMPKLKNSKYAIVHYDSPDRRGIDVALLYRKDFFELTRTRSVRLNIPDSINPYKDEFRSRDQLVVSGIINGELIHFIVNHWPSRRGGERASRLLRNAAADLCRSISDSIFATNKNAKIIIMGDFNDNPNDKSIVKHLRAKEKIEKIEEGDFYNPFYKSYKKGIGTTAYRDTWSLFDQLIVSPALLGKNLNTLKMQKCKIFSRRFIIQKKGKFEGYPKRTFSFDKFQNGYSDHFPVYMFLEVNN